MEMMEDVDDSSPQRFLLARTAAWWVPACTVPEVSLLTKQSERCRPTSRHRRFGATVDSGLWTATAPNIL